jgi:hypothetical protein
MYLDEFDAYPVTVGMGVLGQSSEYGWLMLDNWKETLAPYIGVALKGSHSNGLGGAGAATGWGGAPWGCLASASCLRIAFTSSGDTSFPEFPNEL